MRSRYLTTKLILILLLLLPLVDSSNTWARLKLKDAKGTEKKNQLSSSTALKAMPRFERASGGILTGKSRALMNASSWADVVRGPASEEPSTRVGIEEPLEHGEKSSTAVELASLDGEHSAISGATKDSEAESLATESQSDPDISNQSLQDEKAVSSTIETKEIVPEAQASIPPKMGEMGVLDEKPQGTDDTLTISETVLESSDKREDVRDSSPVESDEDEQSVESYESGEEEEFVTDWLKTSDKLIKMRELQQFRDSTMKNFALVPPLLVGQYLMTPLGSLRIVAVETFDQIRSLNRGLVRGMKGSQVYMIKVGDIQTDFSLLNEFTILSLLSGAGIAPNAHYLSPSMNPFYVPAPRYLVTDDYGPSLHSLMKFTRLSCRKSFDIALDILRLIERMHEIGVVHGDLNEHNVRLGPSGSVWLTDFEFAAFIPDPFRQARSSLPPSFAEHMSPWEMEGSTYSRRDDLYRWMEILAKLMYRNSFRVAQMQNSNGLFENLKHFKLTDMFFDSIGKNGCSPRGPWRNRSPNSRRISKGALNMALNYIRGLDESSEPDYAFITDKLQTAMRFVQ